MLEEEGQRLVSDVGTGDAATVLLLIRGLKGTSQHNHLTTLYTIWSRTRFEA